MKIELNNVKTLNKPLEFEENFWTGRRSIKYNGIPLKKIKNSLFEYQDGEKVEQFRIKGNQFIGMIITMFNNEIELERKLTWYEIVLSILVFLPCFLFGLVGGICGGILGFTNLVIIRQLNKWYLKVIVSILFLTIGMLLSYVIAVLVLNIVFPYL